MLKLETWNPTTGCDRISPGCDHCYALDLARGLKEDGHPHYQADGDSRTSGPGFDLALHEDVLEQPLGWHEPRRVLVNTMSDLFHARVPFTYIERVFRTMTQTPQHRYQLLTKRSKRLLLLSPRLTWPPNVYMGVSIESDRYCFRADHLRAVPAALRFLQLEPLLGPLRSLDLTGIHWVVVGPERGIGARAMAAEWVDDLRTRCTAAGVLFLEGEFGRRPLRELAQSS